MMATVNNNTVAMNVADVLPAILRLTDPEELAYYNDVTPTMLDYLSAAQTDCPTPPFLPRTHVL